MATDKRWKLVCYDVRDQARWRKVYRLVRGHGSRVQYSVFRCRLDSRAIERLRWELSKVMAPEDTLLIIDLCPRCSEHVVSTNVEEDWAEDEPTFRVISPPHQDQVPARE
ncbi:MAG: CRISPR-associated endonuclease Cas2 [Planctomycetes bacterium]|nr:CRISPR-associated endonuclease Cas2 [Planctomycetota bacterium]